MVDTIVILIIKHCILSVSTLYVLTIKLINGKIGTAWVHFCTLPSWPSSQILSPPMAFPDGCSWSWSRATRTFALQAHWWEQLLLLAFLLSNQCMTWHSTEEYLWVKGQARALRGVVAVWFISVESCEINELILDTQRWWAFGRQKIK